MRVLTVRSEEIRAGDQLHITRKTLWNVLRVEKYEGRLSLRGGPLEGALIAVCTQGRLTLRHEVVRP